MGGPKPRSGQSECPQNSASRAAVIQALIPPPPPDIVPLRIAFSKMAAAQWETHVSSEPANTPETLTRAQSAKVRFIAEMYARACYSMLLVSAGGPANLRLPVRATAALPLPRNWTIQLAGSLLASIDWLAPQTMHRQLLLTSMLMGLLDVVLDEAAGAGEVAALRLASSITEKPPAARNPSEQSLVSLAAAIRRDETPWQSQFWEYVLQPAVRDYCVAETLAVAYAPDPSGMGHRWAGIDAAIKGMWYVAGPRMGLQSGSLVRFDQPRWNREQRWMADTSLLMQMIDDWVDQDEDRGTRMTPVAAGDWTLHSVDGLYRKTVQDLAALLSENRIRNRVLQQLFLDLYNDYLHAALDAMRTGVAA